jgi:tetratricopeptide (TPR) repeat protein
MNLEAWRCRLRARLYEFLRRPDRAIAEYRTALGFDPASAQATRALAFLLTSRGHYAEAERYFHAAVRLEPQRAATWFNLGFLYDKQHQSAKAIEAFHEALRINPGLDRAWYGMGLCQTALGQHAAAVKSFEQAGQLQPMNPHAWYHLGLAQHALHNPDKVKETIMHLHRFDPKMTRQLIHDTDRSDLAHLVADLRN